MSDIELNECVEYLVLGITTGAFATFAPVLFGKVYDTIMGIFRISAN